jgi:ribosomal protein S18
MPYTIRLVRIKNKQRRITKKNKKQNNGYKKKNCFQVINTDTRRIFSKCATKENAKKQLRLLSAIKYNKNFRLRNARNTIKREKNM